MFSFRELLGGVLIVLLIGAIAYGIASREERLNTQSQEKLALLTFSNTQEWDMQYYTYILDADPEFLSEMVSRIELPPPPDNTSEETQRELTEMHVLVLERTPEKVTEIESQIVPSTTSPFGPGTFGTFVAANDRPMTSKLFHDLFVAYLPVIMSFKEDFDRVRPHKLDETLTTAIPSPGHPAYPSGHASEAYLMAYLATEFDPENEAAYFESARAIARNREIAGLHYASDSEAGKMLARQYFEIVKEHDKFRFLFNMAKLEWR